MYNVLYLLEVKDEGWGCLIIKGIHAEALVRREEFVLGLCVPCLARWLSSELELQVDFVLNLVTNLSASGASPPSVYSELNR